MPVITRSQRRYGAASMIERLPPDAMTSILFFLNLPERVRFASSHSKRLRSLVYQECSALWVEIDFSSLPYEMRSRLTNEQLASLLTRVNARYVTKRLSVHHCLLVRSRGIRPLRHSRVLEMIDLRHDLWDPSKDKSLLKILRTMIPYRLTDVRLNEWISTGQSDETDFFWDLRLAKQRQAREQHVLCSSCNVQVVDPSMQLVPGRTGPPSTRCIKCERHFCRRGGCSMEVFDCAGCGATKCKECDNKTRCDECGWLFCGECVSQDAFHPCENCQRATKCFYCDWNCSCCDRRVCGECVNPQLDVFVCFICEEQFCDICRFVCGCDSCERLICERCGTVEFCEHCRQRFCMDCREVSDFVNGIQLPGQFCTECRDHNSIETLVLSVS